MHIPPVKNELNINTFVLLGGFFLTLAMTGGGMVYTYAQVTAQVEQTDKAQREFRTTTEARIANFEAVTRQIDQLSYRMAATESATTAFTRAMEELRAATAQQSGDIRVIMTMLQRIERNGIEPTALTRN